MIRKLIKYAGIVLAMLFTLTVSAKDDNSTNSYNYQRGWEELKNGNYEEAAKYIGKELEANPRNGYAYFLLAHIYANNEKYGQALTNIDKALKYVPKKDKDARYSILLSSAGMYLQTGDTIKAFKNLDEAIALQPDKTGAYESRGQLYFEMHKYDLSDKDYNRIIKLNPNSHMGYMGLARNLTENKKWKEAIEKLDYVARLYPDNAQNYVFRAKAYIGLKDYDKATDDIINAVEYDTEANLGIEYLPDELNEQGRELLLTKLKIKARTNPNSSEWPMYIGMVYMDEKKYPEAIEQLKAANNINTFASLLAQIAWCYSEEGLYDKAVEYIDKAAELDTTSMRIKRAKPDYVYNAGRLDEAISLEDKVIAEEPENDLNYYSRASLYWAAREWKKAVDDLTTAITLDPETSAYYSTRADAYEKLGEKDKAKADWEKIVALEKTPGDYYVIHNAYCGLGQYDKAIAAMDTIIARDSTDGGNYYNAACLYTRMGKYKEALAYLGKALEKGYLGLFHISKDADMDPLRNMPEFKALIKKGEENLETLRKEADGDAGNAGSKKTVTTEVPFTKESGSALCNVKCSINGLPLYFIFDTGASTVSLSQVEASFMVKNGYISKSDVVGSQLFTDAIGNVNVGTVINLRTVDFGGLKLNNVKASVVTNQKAPLLLGQTVLSKAGKIEIDNQKRVLKITHEAAE